MQMQVRDRVPMYLVVHFRGPKLCAKRSGNQHAVGPPDTSIVEQIWLLDVSARYHAHVPGQASTVVGSHPTRAQLYQYIECTGIRSVADNATQWAEIVGPARL